MRNLLQQELAELKRRILSMASLVQQSLSGAVDALLNADSDRAQKIFDGDQAINEQRFSIENDAAVVLATQQPVAGDLRLIIGILEIATELERMGDYSKDIARNAMSSELVVPLDIADGIKEMCGLAVETVNMAAHAFVENNDFLAAKVAKDDIPIDQLCERLHRDLIGLVSTNDASLDDVMRILPVVHNVERFADRSLNICERVVYIATGQQVEFD